MKSEKGSETGAQAMAEALAAHLEGRDAYVSHSAGDAEERSEMASLLEVARLLDARMRPVRPAPTFVQSLGQELVREAERRLTMRDKRRRVAMISAAVAGGIVSIASLVGGIVVLVKWVRTRGEARQASTA